jgi:predicted glycosyltransferase involved in capsule biosynthesis
MSNVTFITHLRYDHEDRLFNLQSILNYYSQNVPGSKFIIVEDDKEHNTNFDKIKWPKGTTYFFIKNDSYYYRTRALNYGIKHAQTPVVVSLDTDCIVPISSFNKCVDELLKDATIAWPYNGYFIDVVHELHQKFIDTNYNYSVLYDPLPNIEHLKLGHTINNMYNVRCTNTVYLGVGGIVMFNRERFIEVGGYNQKFVAWGAEDNELDKRISILEHKKFRDVSPEAICFHLFHRNALRNTHPFYQSNFNEAHLVEKMSKDELQKYITTWNYFE